MRYVLLGPIGWEVDGRPVPLGRPRCRAVLSYLLLHANRVVSTHELIEALWGGAEPSTARAQIQGDISALRRAGREAGHPLSLASKAPGYCMTVEPGELDLDVFRTRIAEARTETERGEFDSAIRLIRSGLGAWHGTALADVDVSFAAPARARLTDLRLDAYEMLADLECATGNHMVLADELVPLVTAHPLREDLCRKLMLALYRSGRQTEALEHAHRLRTQLAEEQGLAPGRSFTDLAQAILRADPSLDLPTPTPIPTLQRSVSSGVKPAQLPMAPMDFVGREDLVQQLDQAFSGEQSGQDRPTAVVVAVVGSAGAGKTALVTHWARNNLGHFPDGQLHVNLRGYDTAQPVTAAETLSRFLRALGVAPEATPSDPEESVNLYRSLTAGKQMLVVVDNARSAEQVRPLLAAGPGSLTLVTSRSRLTGLVAQEGARRITVGPLLPGEAKALLEQSLGVERLRAEPGVAAELAQACGALPLALRVAAANLANHPLWRVSDYLDRLLTENRLAALVAVGDESVAVQVVFDQSYLNVTGYAQRMLRLLGLIPGPDFTAQAAATLADLSLSGARALLDQLLDAHLIEEPANGRYALHDLVRLYARDRGQAEDSPDERTAARDRLFDWYVTRSREAADQLFPNRLRLSAPRSTTPNAPCRRDSDAIAWLDDEYLNLLAALREAERGWHTWHLVDALRCYFHLRNNAFDWMSAANAMLTAAHRERNLEAMFHGRYSLAQAFLFQGDYPTAREHFETAVQLAEITGHTVGRRACETNVARVLTATGRPNQAVARLLVLTADGDGGEQTEHAQAFTTLGLAYLDLGRLHDAREALEQALQIHRSTKSRTNEAYALANLGLAAHALGDLADAESLMNCALSGLREIGDTDVESACLSDLALVHFDAERTGTARLCAERAWDLARQVKAPKWALPVLSVLALARRSLQDHQKVIEMAQSSGNSGWQARALLTSARTAGELGRLARAAHDARAALDIARKSGYRVIEGNSLIVLAEAEPPGSTMAVEYATRALEIHQAAGHRLGAARVQELLSGTAKRPFVLEAAAD